MSLYKNIIDYAVELGLSRDELELESMPEDSLRNIVSNVDLNGVGLHIGDFVSLTWMASFTPDAKIVSISKDVYNIDEIARVYEDFGVAHKILNVIGLPLDKTHFISRSIARDQLKIITSLNVRFDWILLDRQFNQTQEQIKVCENIIRRGGYLIVRDPDLPNSMIDDNVWLQSFEDSSIYILKRTNAVGDIKISLPKDIFFNNTKEYLGK